jgi:hypothetical protein
VATENLPKEKEVCPERDECLSLKGAPIGMYHCSHCGQMILAGQDPTDYCPAVECLNPKQEQDNE